LNRGPSAPESSTLLTTRLPSRVKINPSGSGAAGWANVGPRRASVYSCKSVSVHRGRWCLSCAAHIRSDADMTSPSQPHANNVKPRLHRQTVTKLERVAAVPTTKVRTVSKQTRYSGSRGYLQPGRTPWELTCHMGSHSVTCHPAKVTFSPLSQPKLVLCLATKKGCMAELT